MKTIDMTKFNDLYALSILAVGDPYSMINKLKGRAELYNAIIGYLATSPFPLRCRDIAAKFGTHTVECWDGVTREFSNKDWHAISARLRPMLRDGIVERVKIGTNTIMTRNGYKTVDIYGYKLTAED